MGRKNGEGSGSTPTVLKLEEANKRTLVGGKVEEEEEGQFQFQFQFQFQSVLLQQQPPPPPPLTMPKKQRTATTALGHIVAVPGGHIVRRPTGSKDRHSKVCTAKGLRDRRVRLSARTAIEFYDVQDRLGYARPSMAVDWLLENAKAAIDELDELPPWQPSADAAAASDGGVAIDSSFLMASSSYPPPPDLLSRTGSHVQLSLDCNPNPFFFDTGAGGESPSVPTSWMDQIVPPTTSSQSITHPPPAFQYPSSSSSFPDIDQFGPNGVFSGFGMPTWWIQGEEHGDGVSDEPPASRR